MKHLYFLCVVFVFLFAGYALSQGSNKEHNLTPVDYVNPYMGNISHLLVPTYSYDSFAQQHVACISRTE